MKQRLKNYFKPFLNWKFDICFLIPWLFTNGFWYLLFFISIKFKIYWLTSFTGAYLGWLYSPFGLEKLFIIPIAILICRLLFKNDERTMNDLHNMWEQAKHDFSAIKLKIKKIFKKARRKK